MPEGHIVNDPFLRSVSDYKNGNTLVVLCPDFFYLEKIAGQNEFNCLFDGTHQLEHILMIQKKNMFNLDKRKNILYFLLSYPLGGGRKSLAMYEYTRDEVLTTQVSNICLLLKPVLN